MNGFISRLREERGISSVIVAVSLVGLFGAAILAIDAGSAWATRRQIVTGTDAGALAAARLFSRGSMNGGLDPCTQAASGEAEATAVLMQNASKAEHNSSGYQVTVSSGCPSSPVGHVRFDAKLSSAQGFSGIFGFGNVKPFSSSTAEFGYVTTISSGLRPFAVCDQHLSWNPANPPPNPLPNPAGPAPYPHWALWNWLRKGLITQAQYDAYFGTNANQYPTQASMGKNANHNYLSPAQGGGVVHKIDIKDSCTSGASSRGWVDYNGGSNPTGDLIAWLTSGYPGTVALTPHDCGSGNADGNCAGYPGNHNGLKSALDSITCDYNTPSKDCLVFPVILTDSETSGGNGAEIDQTAFLFVILRGWASDNQNNPCNGNASCLLDLEFVNQQADGKIGGDPHGDHSVTTPRGTDLCGIDHDSFANRCNV